MNSKSKINSGKDMSTECEEIWRANAMRKANDSQLLQKNMIVSVADFFEYCVDQYARMNSISLFYLIICLQFILNFLLHFYFFVVE